MASKLLKLLPKHEQYVEPYFGGGSVFFAKTPCQHETINDADEGVTGFFRVLRDRGEEFVARCQLTEYSEVLYRDCRDTWHDEPDELLRAWKWFVVARQSFSRRFGAGQSHSRTESIRCMPGTCAQWQSAIDHLPEIVARLKCTQILTGDALRALRCTDTPDCLAYLDPPYVHGTRIGGSYAHEMDDAAHIALVDYLLNEWSGRAILSGYDCELYTPLTDAGWARVTYQTSCYAAGRTRATGIIGDGAAMRMQGRTESIWLDPATAAEVLPAAQATLALEAAG
jgi:DNA adenine methylase